jgi:hypothetical protein
MPYLIIKTGQFKSMKDALPEIPEDLVNVCRHFDMFGIICDGELPELFKDKHTYEILEVCDEVAMYVEIHLVVDNIANQTYSLVFNYSGIFLKELLRKYHYICDINEAYGRHRS